jgi:Zn-dependent M28 family amino/carboxypeptidase
MAGGGILGGLAHCIRRPSGAGGIGALILASMVLFSAAGFSDGTDAAIMSSRSYSADSNDVSGDNIVETIEDLQAFGSRDFHLDSALEAAQYIYDRFVAMGIETARQDFNISGYISANVIATIPGHDEGGIVVLGAHYDSENSLASDLSESENTTAPGADDNGSGVAVMLEVARIVSGGRPVAPTIEFVAFGAEESGFDGIGGTAGSMRYAMSLTQAGTDVAAGLVLDMVGYRSSEPSRLTIVSNSADDPFVRASASALEGVEAALELEVIVNADITYSDHHSFWLEGYSCALLTEELSDELVPVNPYYHTSWDTVDTLSTSQLTAAAEFVLESTIGVAGSPGDTVDLVPIVTLAAAMVASGVVVFAVVSTRRLRK